MSGAIHHFDDVKSGFEVSADAVVVGTGAGGAVAAANLAEAGLNTVVLEAGPQLTPEMMTRDAPRFLARYFWDGGLRLLAGSAPIPTMQGRCLGGSTVANSAIMLKLPDYVRREWIEQDGLDQRAGPELDACFERIFAGTKTQPTPLDVMGPRNFSIRDALTAMGVKSGPLPRAVDGCEGCADCLVGCACGAKQSTDRSYIPKATAHGAQVFTCAQVDRVLMEGRRAAGVEGRVMAVRGRRIVGHFTVRAPLVVLAAGAVGTPCILQKSRINPGGMVGATLKAHITSGVFGIMEQPMEPWVGATQGWGALSEDIKGMKFESLWADPSAMLVKWGGFGPDFMRRLEHVRHATIGAVVYRGKCTGRVKARRDGSAKMSLWIPKSEAQTVLRGCKLFADGLLETGARYVFAGVIPGVPEEMRTAADTETLLSTKLNARHLAMTANHVFTSCRMTADEKAGPVAPDGSLRGVEGVFVTDASIFPSPSAVNPQATVMALSDMISRRLGEMAIN